MSESLLDVVIIGGGPGGYNCATRCGQLGLKVALIEKRDKLGGTCLNVGCIPSKAMLHASELYETAGKDFAGLGIEVTGLKLNLENMLKQKADAVTGPHRRHRLPHEEEQGDRVQRRRAHRWPGPRGGRGETQVLETKNIVIATGSEPTPLHRRGDRRGARGVVHRRAVAEGRAQAHDRDRRGHHRPGAGLGLAPRSALK